MSSNTPVVRQISWARYILIISLFSGVALAAYFLLPIGRADLVVGGLLFLFLFHRLVTARYLIARHQTAGMRAVRAQRWEDAVASFRASYEFFDRYSWVDRWRALTLISSSRISYREMALVNEAFCLTQTGDGAAGRAAYERVLREFPDSAIARTALTMMDSVRTR